MTRRSRKNRSTKKFGVSNDKTYRAEPIRAADAGVLRLIKSKAAAKTVAAVEEKPSNKNGQIKLSVAKQSNR